MLSAWSLTDMKADQVVIQMRKARVLDIKSGVP